jgi:GTP-binding protein
MKSTHSHGIVWNNSQFITSAVWPEHYPPICNKSGTKVPQIALAGRSNVGKSSLLNALLSTRQLAKVSSTPGKTQLINFFLVDNVLVCVDLPGYGFAQCPQAVKKEWGKMINCYFEKMKDIALLFFLLDIRRTPNEEDLQLLEWANYHQIPLQIVLTKVDKLNKSERASHTKKILETLPTEVPYILHSSHSQEGTDALRKCIALQVLQGNSSCPS